MKLQSFAYPGRPFVVVLCCRWGSNSGVGQDKGEGGKREVRVCCIFLDLRVIDLPSLVSDAIYAQR